MDRAQVYSRLQGPWEGGREGGPGCEKLWDGGQAGPSPCCPGREQAEPGTSSCTAPGSPQGTNAMPCRRKTHPNRQNIFMRVYLSHTDSVPGSETSNAPEADSSAVSFMRLSLRRGCPEAYRTLGESQAGPDCRLGNEVACSLQEGYRLVQRCVKLDAQEQRAGLAKSAGNLLPKETEA